MDDVDLYTTTMATLNRAVTLIAMRRHARRLGIQLSEQEQSQVSARVCEYSHIERLDIDAVAELTEAVLELMIKDEEINQSPQGAV